MKKRILSILLAIMMIVSMMPLSVMAYDPGITPEEDGSNTTLGSYFAGGTGVESDPYLISTKEHLENLAMMANALNDEYNVNMFENTYFKLTADIGTPGNPVTNGIGGNNGFSGRFDGNGHKITIHFTDNTITDNEDIALFSILVGGEIKNLTLAGSIDVTDCYSVGGIVGSNSGIVYNCINTATIHARYSENYANIIDKCLIGGVVAISYYTCNCVNVGKITVECANDSVQKYIGEIAGADQARQTSYCFGLSGTGNPICGWCLAGELTDCYLLPETQMKAANGTTPQDNWAVINSSAKPLVDLLNGYSAPVMFTEMGYMTSRSEWKATGLSYPSFDGAVYVSDILAANPELPTASSDGWVRKAGEAKMYVHENDAVRFLAVKVGNSALFLSPANKLTEVSTGVYETADANGKWTFTLDTDGTTLKSVTFAHASDKDENLKYDGTYEPPVPLIPVDVPTFTDKLMYNGEEQTGIAEGTGYTVTNGKATNAGEYIATATLEDGYCWSDKSTEAKEIQWAILPAVITSASAADVAYTGKQATPEIEVMAGDLVVPADGYEISWEDDERINPGHYAGTVTGKGNFTDTANIDFFVTDAVIDYAFAASQKYTGEALTPVITVKSGKTVCTTYTLSDWDGDLVNPGTYTATVTGTGCFKGEKQVTFTITVDPTYEYYLVEAPTVEDAGTYNQRSFYLNKAGEKVIIKERIYDIDKTVTFAEWYLRTMVQYKDGGNGKLDVRFVSMLDENLDQYMEAGFIINDGTTEITIQTTEGNTSFVADGVTVSIDQYSQADDFFFLEKNVFASEVVAANPTISVTPYVKLIDGTTTICGNVISFKLSDLK